MKCEKCSYSTQIEACLKAHVKAVHDGTKDQKCDQCDYVATRAYSLKIHRMHVHQGIKRKETAVIECEKCPYTSTPGNVKRHVKLVHDQIKDQICEECGKGFSSKEELKSHTVKVHQTRRECDKCDFITFNYISFKDHKQTAHERAKPKKLSEKPRPVLLKGKGRESKIVSFDICT